ncbi:oxidoreductase, partial [Escherichia coli]|uniref:oxidoreductase n=1 Tax=Escherichia coli TaxID=562 RepID=UPI003FA552B9
YLAAEFFSPLANHRDDSYGGSLENRSRFLLEALDAVREVWPERYPLTMRLGSDDAHPDGVQFDDAVTAIGWMAEHGLDMADVSMGFNTANMQRHVPFDQPGFMAERAVRVRKEVGIPMMSSWNLGNPKDADAAIRDELVDLALLGHPAP